MFLKTYNKIGKYYIIQHGIMPINVTVINNIDKKDINDDVIFWVELKIIKELIYLNIC